MPPSTLGRPRLSTRRSLWGAIFGSSAPEGGSQIGSVRVAPDDPTIPQRYTSTLLGRAPLRELGPADVSRVSDLRGTRRVDEVRFALGVSRSNRRADRLAAILDNARAERDASATASPPRTSVAAEAARFSRAFHWALSIPGTHYSGLSNDALAEVLAAQGRPFLSDTPELRDHVRERLSAGLREWDSERAVAIAARATRDWIVARIERGGVDVELDALDPDYRAQKTADGFDRRIGIKTGAWLGSVKNAVVEIAAA